MFISCHGSHINEFPVRGRLGRGPGRAGCARGTSAACRTRHLMDRCGRSGEGRGMVSCECRIRASARNGRPGNRTFRARQVLAVPFALGLLPLVVGPGRRVGQRGERGQEERPFEVFAASAGRTLAADRGPGSPGHRGQARVGGEVSGGVECGAVVERGCREFPALVEQRGEVRRELGDDDRGGLGPGDHDGLRGRSRPGTGGTARLGMSGRRRVALTPVDRSGRDS